MRRIQDYDKEGFEGLDVDLSISLFDYGLIWKLVDTAKEEYKFIYGVNQDGSNFTVFDYGFIDKKEFISTIEEEWFQLKKVLEFCGMNQEEFIGSLPYAILASIQYHGIENIFGGSYYPYEILAE